RAGRHPRRRDRNEPALAARCGAPARLHQRRGFHPRARSGRVPPPRHPCNQRRHGHHGAGLARTAEPVGGGCAPLRPDGRSELPSGQPPDRQCRRHGGAGSYQHRPDAQLYLGGHDLPDGRGFRRHAGRRAHRTRPTHRCRRWPDIGHGPRARRRDARLHP
ncbi:hypothetical protein KXX40_000470, partial [Aspergillus fumigatus]